MSTVFPILCHLKKEVSKFIPKNKEQLSFISNLISSLNKTELCDKHTVLYSGSSLLQHGVERSPSTGAGVSQGVSREKTSHRDTAP